MMDRRQSFVCAACRARDHRYCLDGSALASGATVRCSCPCGKAPVPVTERPPDAHLEQEYEDRMAGGAVDEPEA